jgi:lipoyl(octanoyl) transferase
LKVYLLGSLEWESALALQRHLLYEITGARSTAALVLCEHPPLITIGRHGSRSQLLCKQGELAARRWQVRWVNRGGGCLLHSPGQLAIYGLVPLDRFRLGVHAYLGRLQRALTGTLADVHIPGSEIRGRSSVCVGARLIAAVGVAVRDWVTYHGAFLNISPDLELYRSFRWDSANAPPMTSMARECRSYVRPSQVRERIVEHFASGIGFDRISLFMDHPSLKRKAACNALAASS